MLVLNKIYSSVWAATEETMREIEEVVLRHIDYKITSLEEFEAIEARLGKPLKNNPDVVMRGDTAIIPIHGSIVRKGHMFSRLSGTTSTEKLAKDFTQVLEDKSVSSIVFDISSGGGEAEGISEFADMVYQARGTKPIKAYVSGNAQSAAYWIAAATDEIITNDIAGLGSIGVAIFMDDDSQVQDRRGIKEIVFKSTKSPNKLPDFRTEEGAKLIQEKLDSMADVFLNKVALYRSNEKNGQLTAEKVVKNFKQGGTALGEEAVRIGLADRLGSLEGLLKELREKKMDKPKEQEELRDDPATIQFDESKFVSADKFSELMKKLESVTSANETLAEQVKSYETKVKESEVKLLLAEANKKAESFGKKLDEDGRKEYVKLFLSFEGDTDKISALDKIVGSNKGLDVLTDEQLLSEDLRILESEPISDDEEKAIDALTKQYAESVNKRNK